MKNEKGYILLVTLMTLVFISIIGFSLFTITQTTHSQTTSERKDQSVFYVAESGLNIKEARLVKLIDQAYQEAKASEDTFEQTFNSKLATILNTEKNSVYDHHVFNSSYNGKPNATVSVQYDPLNPRSFKIVSKGTLIETNQERSVEKSYTIPLTLVQKTTVQVPVTNVQTPTETSPSQPPVVSISSKANIYLSKGIFLDAVIKKKLSFKASASFEKNTANIFKEINTRVTPISVLDNVVFNEPKVNITPTKVTHNANPSFSESMNDSLKLDSTLQTINKDFKMPDFNGKSNLVFNLNVEGNRTIYFNENLNKYNLTTVRMNVTGHGTLNLVFKNNFQLDTGRKFYINAPNTKVNTIFKQYAHIHGELNVQDIYMVDNVANESSLITYSGGKIIAKDIYTNSADIAKYINGNIQANTISIKKGNIETTGAGTILANHIQLENGRINMTGSIGNITRVVSKSITIEKDLNINAYSCLMAENLFVMNGSTNIHGNANFNKLYTATLTGTIGAEINTNLCTYNPITITPPPNEVATEYKNVDQYSYLHDTNYLQTHPLIEID